MIIFGNLNKIEIKSKCHCARSQCIYNLTIIIYENDKIKQTDVV